MDTFQLFDSSDTGFQINRFIWNYYYKQNYAGEHMKQPHAHNAMEIECIIDGQLVLKFENESLRLSRNDIVIIKPNVEHQFYIPTSCKTCKRVNIAILSSIFEGTGINAVFANIFNSYPQDYLLLEQSSIIQELMSHIVRELSQRKWGYNTIVKSELTSLMILLLRSIRRDSHRNKLTYAQQARELMDAAPAESWTPAGLAKELNISPSYLMHIFHAEYSVTLMKHLESKRLEMAKKLLTDTRKSIFDISVDVGFSTLQHFSYVFKKNVGISPTQYRKVSQEIMYKIVDIGEAENP